MADEAATRPIVETIPSQAGSVSAIASGNAPFIYFDNAVTFGYNDGVANITLEAVRFMPTDSKAIADRVVVAHLRMGHTALQSLKNAINGIELLAKPVPQTGVN